MLTSVEDAVGIPGIPSQPIGYGDAEVLLAAMGGPRAPEAWQGEIPGLVYRLGPDTKHRGWAARLSVNNFLAEVKSDNVIGIIRGREEPDRLVIMGNHRDAWGYGASDPSSGTAAMMEMARIFGQRLRQGWRPRRTIVLANWASEEAGLMSSYEWVMDKIHHLTHR